MDDQAAGMGHNRPPEPTPYDEAIYSTLELRLTELADAGGAWLDKGPLETEEQAGRLVDALAQVKAHAKAIEDARKAAKQPHLDAGRAVDAAFERLAAPVKKLVDRLGSLLTAYQVEKQRRLDEERRAREAEAARAEAAARKAAEEAAARNDVIGAAAAEAAEAEARKAAEAAAKPVRARVESTTGGARTVGLRDYHTAAFDPALPREVARVKALNALCRSAHYAEKIDEFLLGAAEAARRAKGGPETIPGIQFTITQKAV